MKRIEKEFGIKVGSKAGLEERLARIVPKLREIGKTQDIASWLTTNIGTSQENALALQQLMPNYEAFTGRMQMAREMARTGGASVLADNAAWQKSRMGQSMIAEAQADAGRFLQGERVSDFAALTAKAQAEIENRPLSILGNLKSAVHSVADYALGPAVGSEAEERTNARLSARLGAAGLSDPFNSPVGALRGMFMTPAEKGNEMIETLRRNKIDPMSVTGGGVGSNLEAKLDLLIAAQERNNQLLAQGNQQRAQGNQQRPPLPPGKPVGQPARP
jgi:hypothetical protein